jgi:hypothetical protein
LSVDIEFAGHELNSAIAICCCLQECLGFAQGWRLLRGNDMFADPCTFVVIDSAFLQVLPEECFDRFCRPPRLLNKDARCNAPAEHVLASLALFLCGEMASCAKKKKKTKYTLGIHTIALPLVVN